jgi:hypothetical protein
MASVKTAHLDRLSTQDSCKSHGTLFYQNLHSHLLNPVDAAQLSILDTAEIAVTIMAASIPTMRVLFRDLQSSSKRYGTSGRTGGTAPERKYESHHNSEPKSRELKDDDSDTDILSPSTPTSGNILRTEEVELHYDSARDMEAYEMHDVKRK